MGESPIGESCQRDDAVDSELSGSEQSSQISLDFKLQRFADAIGVANEQQQVIFESFTWLYEQVLSAYPYLLEAKISGPMAMNTMLADEKIVDVELLLEPKFSDITPSSVLRKLYKDLLHSYQSAKLDLSVPAILVTAQNTTFRFLVRICDDGKTFYPDVNGLTWLQLGEILPPEQRFCDADQSLQGRLSTLTKLIKYWARKHNIKHKSLSELENVVFSLCGYNASVRSGLQLLLLYFPWHDDKYTAEQLENMDDSQFAMYCHQHLLGNEFV